MKQENELKYYEEVKDWNFDKFEIETQSLTKWDLYEELKEKTNPDSKILDLGTGGGEKVLTSFPQVKEILGTDFSKEMIKTANENLKKSGKKNITFRIMDNLKMDVPDCYYDVVVARNTVTDPKQIYKALRKGGHLLIRGVDKYDCWNLKLMYGKGQAFSDGKPISIIDYENVINAGFKDVELIPIHVREYFKSKELFIEFLKKVPIIDDFSELEDSGKMHYNKDLDESVIEKYIKENTYNGKIRLLRRYYGIVAKK